MADATAPQRVAANMAGLTVDAISKALDVRISAAAKMSGGAQGASMDFNARLVTALREAELWPSRPVKRSSSFQ